jgi:hypothetical protein
MKNSAIKSVLTDGFRTRAAACFLALCFFSSAASGLFAAEPVLLNFESREKNEYTRFEAQADFATIRRWALNRNLSIIPDSPPFADKNAHFVSRAGSFVKIRDLDPNAQYTLYVDFVSYGGGNGSIVSRLDIRCDGEKVSELRFGEQGPGYVAVPIPRNQTLDGEVTVLFDDFSVSSGVWGIWDMILSDGPLPEKINYVKEIPQIKDSSGKAPDPRGGKKDRPVQKKEAAPPDVKPSAKPVQEPKDVIIPETREVPETKKPDPAQVQPPKLPSAPGVKDIRD